MLVARLVSRIHFEAPVTIVHHPVTSQPSSNHVVQSCKCTFIMGYLMVQRKLPSHKKLDTSEICVFKDYVYWAWAFLDHLGVSCLKCKKDDLLLTILKSKLLQSKTLNLHSYNSQHLSLLPTLTTKKAKLRFSVNPEFYVRFFLPFNDCSCKPANNCFSTIFGSKGRIIST